MQYIPIPLISSKAEHVEMHAVLLLELYIYIYIYNLIKALNCINWLCIVRGIVMYVQRVANLSYANRNFFNSS